MDIKSLKKISDYQWVLEPFGKMRVPVIAFAGREIIEAMDQKAFDQAANVATLPGIVKASYMMPDAHWGYGFPIGGVAAFDPEKGGVVSAGGVGFDIGCGVRTLLTGLTIEDVADKKAEIADMLAKKIPAGVGSTGKLTLNSRGMDDMLTGGARWTVQLGYGLKDDLLRIEQDGCMAGAKPQYVSDHAKKRQREQVGTLGSGNHYLEVQHVVEIFNDSLAKLYGLKKDDIVISIHCGSRGLGHQIGTDYLAKMVGSAWQHGLQIPDRELACAPLDSKLGQEYLGAMRAGVNCALANRQVLTHLVRQAVSKLFVGAEVRLLYDVSHNTCKEEVHKVDGKDRCLFVHRKGATRSFAPGSEGLTGDLKTAGQPVLIGGTMGTSSYILSGTDESMSAAFGSSCHGAGRSMSRHQATKKWRGSDVVKSLGYKGILIRSPSLRGIAEEAPNAYKDVDAVVESAHRAKLSAKVAKLQPLVCVKG